ncbi:MBL fold metallo-hydrolase [Brenneria tiliae]|uniref:MBL fold metallo-hydrolase n=1 Tax=Brenneria tiliae TaxID=2914984 RepID=A0ABT0MVU0_9GAMM|nr:MBL fold metallo-hydrolase [Brenneria tiliae]MCL2893892.1 MBL fold metallo-hydrolase [Brenneria tiliae]
MNQMKSFALLLLAFISVPVIATAQPVAQIKTQAGFYRLLLGQFEITALADGTNAMPVDKLLARTSAEQINSLLAQQSLAAPVDTSINAYLINTGKNLILVDSGNGKQGNPSVGKVVNNLKAAGYTPEQVDSVLITHLHGDHFGGLVDDGKLAFPNATVYVSQAETDYWLSEANLQQAADARKPAFQRVQETFRIIKAADKLKTFTGEQALFAGITPQPTPGHTPGHTAFLAESDGEKLLLWGDIIHVAAVQFPLPATTISFDSDMDAAAQTRHKVLEDAASQGYLVAGSHISFPGIGRVKAVKTDDGKPNGYRWVPINYSVAGLTQ